MIELFISAASSVMNIEVLALILCGVVVGLIFGAIPGLSTTMAIALCLPLTFSMDLFMGVALLIGLYIGGFSGGLVSAILLNVPGTAASIATTFDGYPMAQKGQAGKALGLGIVFSFVGGGIGIIALIFMSPLLAQLAIRFGSFEFFSLSLFALTMIVTMSSENIIRGVMSGLLGILLASIGGAPIDGLPRLTFGIHDLDSGFNLVAVLIGIFAVSELFLFAKGKTENLNLTTQESKIKGFGFSVKEFFAEAVNTVRSSIIGVLIGILPGIGGSLASMMAYDVAKRSSKTAEDFGKGINAGLVASESANNASIGGALIPLLTLGIPGDTVTALLLGAFTMQGVMPGPLLFKSNPALIYFMFAALIVANFFMLGTEFLAIRCFVKLLKISKHILLPLISFLCIIGAYGLNYRIFDVLTIFIFGILGYYMKQWQFSIQPFIIGYIIGPMAELNFRRALMFSDNSFIPFFTSPISLFFILASALSVVLAIWKSVKRKKSILSAQ
jgi:putative tricarboxylic transport membrane protein